MTTARYFSAYPSDPASRRTPCPPKLLARWLQVRLGRLRLSPSCPFRLLHTFHSLRPARHYPRFWIQRSSSERRRDLNPPDLGAAQRTLRSSPPLPAAVVLSASQFRCLYLFPWHRRTGSQVPYESPNESHASYTPGTAWPVGRFPPHSSWSSSATPVLMPPKRFDASPKVRLRSSLSSIPDVINVTSFNHDVYYRSF